MVGHLYKKLNDEKFQAFKPKWNKHCRIICTMETNVLVKDFNFLQMY